MSMHAIYSRPLFYLSLRRSRNSDPGPHINSRLFSHLPTTVRALHFCREKISALSSLVDLHRTVLTQRYLSRLSQQLLLILFYFRK